MASASPSTLSSSSKVMKVTHIETIHVRPRWLFVKVHTDAGIIGLGEATLEGRSQTVETAVREIARYLVGKNPLTIEEHWQTINRGTFYRNGPVLASALSGIDQALWDILGKHLNTPVHQLLGGKVRHKIRMYGWVAGEATGDYIENFKTSLSAGFTAYKTCPVPAVRYLETPAVMARVVQNVAQLRALAGQDVDIGLDFHGRTTPALAKRLCKKLEEFDPMFVEEPVLPGNVAALKEISRATSIPIATGERLFTRWEFQEVVEQQAVAIIQPDLSHCGGISERMAHGLICESGAEQCRRIASMAEPKGIAVAPHCPLGPIALAAALQVDATLPNFLCQEHLTLGEGYLKTPFVAEGGYIAVPDGPGLGIELDDAFVASMTFAGDWETPQFRLEDGSFAEW